MNSKLIDLSIIVPVYRDVETLSILCEDFKACIGSDTSYEIIFINDGNYQNAVTRQLEELVKMYENVRAIHFSRCFGQHAGIAAGLKNANGKFMISMDSDLQYSAADCFSLYSIAVKEAKDLVLSTVKVRRHQIFKSLAIKVFYRLLSGIGTPVIRDDLGSVFVIRRNLAEGLARMYDRYRFTITMALWLTDDVAYAEVKHSPRRFGKSGYSFAKSLQHALTGITSFSSRPLLISLGFSAFFAFLAIILIGYFLFHMFVSGHHYLPGWASVMLAVLSSSTVILASQAIQGIYIGRIFDSTKGRPLYFLQSKSNAEAKLFEDRG